VAQRKARIEREEKGANVMAQVIVVFSLKALLGSYFVEWIREGK